MRLDDFRASLFPASSPPASGLTVDSCSYGREFATRFFQLHLAATPCVSLRLPSSAPVGSFHPTRFCPCWAHWRTRPRVLRSHSCERLHASITGLLYAPNEACYEQRRLIQNRGPCAAARRHARANMGPGPTL